MAGVILKMAAAQGEYFLPIFPTKNVPYDAHLCPIIVK